MKFGCLLGTCATALSILLGGCSTDTAFSAASGDGGSVGAGGAPGAGGAAGAGRDAGRDLVASSGGSSGGTCTIGAPLSGGTSHCSSQGQGNLSGGFAWSIWSSGSGGCIITYNAGCAFKATWKESGDFLARAGYQWNSTQTFSQLGTITADYAFTKTGTGGGYSYIGIYGWSQSPLVEFYIVEDSFGKPNPGTKVGTITVDGDAYTVYKNTRVNQPSIEGTSTFEQIFSVRQSLRQCGHINLTAHFTEWDKLGLKLGKMYEAKILAEAGGGTGTVDFTSATMSITK
jgi:endo-1,4-beta-xylanase